MSEGTTRNRKVHSEMLEGIIRFSLVHNVLEEPFYDVNIKFFYYLIADPSDEEASKNVSWIMNSKIDAAVAIEQGPYDEETTEGKCPALLEIAQ